MENLAFGNRVKAIRKKLKLNQAEFGKRFVPPAPKSAVSRWEHGGTPNKARLQKIAEWGNMTIDDLLRQRPQNRIRSLMNENNISIQQLSESTQISEAAIKSYIDGDKDPSIDDWISMADYFDVTISYLKGETRDRNGIFITTISSFENFAKLQGLHQEDVEKLSSMEKEQISTTNFQFGILLAALTTDIGSKDTKKENIKVSKEALDNLTSIINAWLIVNASDTNGESRLNLMSGINEVTKKYLQQLGKYLDQHKL